MSVVDVAFQEELKTRPVRQRLVVGPPGCGKSTRLGRICQHAARHYGSDKILVMSLTRSAASEIANKQIDGHRVPVPKQNIGTMHAFAYRALDRPEIADTPKGLELWNSWITEQGYPTYRLTVENGNQIDDAATEGGAVMQAGGDEFLQAYNIARARLQSVESLPLTVQGFVTWWERFKGEHNSMDFAEMLERAYHDVEEAPGSPNVILMDEGQDTPRLGMRLARKWGEQADWFFVVGDPLQNLYSWAGTDPEAFTGQGLPPDQTEILAQSYRVPRKIRDFAFRWIEPHKLKVERQLGKVIEYNPRREYLGKDAHGETLWGEPVEGEIRALPSATWKLPEPAVRDCLKYLEQGKDVFFIAACSYMLQPTLSVLRQMGIPFWNPWRTTRGDWNPLHATRGTSSAQRLLSFLRLDERAWGDDVRVWNAKELWAWIEIMEVKGLLKRGAKDQIKAAADKPMQHDPFGNPLSGELDLPDLETWFESLDGIVDVMGLIAEGSALDWFRDRLLSSKRKAVEFPLTIAAKYGPQKLREQPRVTVGTIHSLKGAEASVCYLFPDLSAAGMANWNRPGSEQDGVRRAFYVGATRASETLVLCQRASMSAITWPSIQG